jgi:hypothetical protein
MVNRWQLFDPVSIVSTIRLVAGSTMATFALFSQVT